MYVFSTQLFAVSPSIFPAKTVLALHDKTQTGLNHVPSSPLNVGGTGGSETRRYPEETQTRPPTHREKAGGLPLDRGLAQKT